MFTQIFNAHAFQRRKKTVKLTVSFALLGSLHVKAARKTFGEINQWGYFHKPICKKCKCAIENG